MRNSQCFHAYKMKRMKRDKCLTVSHATFDRLNQKWINGGYWNKIEKDLKFVFWLVDVWNCCDEKNFGFSVSPSCQQMQLNTTNQMVTTRSVSLLPFIRTVFWALIDTTRTKGRGAEDKSWGIHPIWGSKAPSSLILCHSKGMAWLSLDLPLKSKRLIVVNEKGSSKWMVEEYERREGLFRSVRL